MVRAARASLAVLIALAFGSLAWAIANRIRFPYDLEWMESGMLCQALQIDQGRPLYGPPSVRFVAYPYTPLYPMVVAGLGRLLGLGYALARTVSVLAFAAAVLLAYTFVRKEGGRPLFALASVAIVAAAYAPTGAWYDLARVDGLFLALTAAGVLAAWWRPASAAGAGLAGVLLVAAFFTKQTAAPFIVTVGAVLFFMRRHTVPAYLAGLTLAAVPAFLWAHLSSGGWFWTYAVGVHQGHHFGAARAFLWTPVRVALLIGPGLALVPWALARRRSPALVYTTAIAGAAVVASCLAAGLDWSYFNVLIPGVFFAAVAIGVAASALDSSATPGRRSEPLVAWMLAGSIAIAPGGLVALLARMMPESARAALEVPLGYDLRPFVPKAADRAAGDALITRLRATPGEVFVPFHNFYGHLAGKRTYLHALNLGELQLAGLGPPRDLVDAIRNRAFALIVLDAERDRLKALDPAAQGGLEAEAFAEFPRLAGNYEITEHIDGPRVFSGGDFQPAWLARPRPLR
jgi:hypothetical protein